MAGRGGVQTAYDAAKASGATTANGIDPFDSSAQEQYLRDQLAAEGYTEHPYGVGDRAIARDLGLEGNPCPDCIARNPQTGNVVIAEAKGSDLFRSIEQLTSGYDAVPKGGLSASQISFQIQVNSYQWPKLFQPGGVAGYRFHFGFLAWESEPGVFEYAMIAEKYRIPLTKGY